MQGEVEAKIVAQSARDGTPLPDKIANAPTLLPGLDLYYTAFFDLSPSRSFGMAAGPIPWGAIAQYAAYYQFDLDQEEELFYFVRHLDNEYLRHEHSKIKRTGKK